MDEDMPTAGLARLVPPSGGERRLREALRDREAHGTAWRLPLAGAFASLCVLVLAFATMRPDASMDTRIRHALDEAATPTDGVRVAGARVESVATRDPGVRIYRVTGLAQAH